MEGRGAGDDALHWFLQPLKVRFIVCSESLGGLQRVIGFMFDIVPDMFTRLLDFMRLALHVSPEGGLCNFKAGI